MKKNITFLIIIINIFFSFSQNNVEYFIKHKVKKKETIFSLSTKFHKTSWFGEKGEPSYK